MHALFLQSNTLMIKRTINFVASQSKIVKNGILAVMEGKTPTGQVSSHASITLYFCSKYTAASIYQSIIISDNHAWQDQVQNRGFSIEADCVSR